jgi:hypothetical protein
MKPKLKGFYSIDIPEGPPTLPPDVEDCWIVVQAEIGPELSEACDVFTFYVCTIKFLQRILSKQSYQYGKSVILMEKFSWEIIENSIKEICGGTQGDSWEEIAARLSKYWDWEFEDYRESN